MQPLSYIKYPFFYMLLMPAHWPDILSYESYFMSSNMSGCERFYCHDLAAQLNDKRQKERIYFQTNEQTTWIRGGKPLQDGDKNHKYVTET